MRYLAWAGGALAGLIVAGLVVALGVSVVDSDPAAAIGIQGVRPEPTPTVTPRPDPPFKPKRILDPGPAERFSSCDRAFDQAMAARSEVIRRAKQGDVNGALSALVAEMRMVVANSRCFVDDFVETAKDVKLNELNKEVPPRIQSAPRACRQVITDAFRLLGLATGAAEGTEGDLDLGAGIDALGERNPRCLTPDLVSKLKSELAKELPTGS